MLPSTDAIVQQLTSLVDATVVADSQGYEWTGDKPIDDRENQRLYTRCLAALDRLAPPGSAYVRLASELEGVISYQLIAMGGIIEALRDDYAAGAMANVEALVHADLFDDFLEMAAELLGKHYHGPAAVLAGSVLEEHLRKLASRHDLDLTDDRGRPKTVEKFGVELVKCGVIVEPQRKIITGWYAQRTEGAHGRFENVIPEEVERMIGGIRDFIARYPA